MWSKICDQGTVEQFDATEWSDSDDQVRLREYVELLNRTLVGQLYPDVRYWDRDGCFAMSGLPRGRSIRRSYRSLKRNSKISVVSRYEKKTEDGRVFEWFRHLAFRPQFRRLSGQWYLEITPTYRFTKDGFKLDRFHESRLKRIKEFEGNRAVLSAILYWSDYLSSCSSLLDSPPLKFGQSVSFEASVGLSDELWSGKSEAQDSGKDDGGQLDLLSELWF